MLVAMIVSMIMRVVVRVIVSHNLMCVLLNKPFGQFCCIRNA